MSSLLACNAKHGFLYLAYQHKEVTRMTFAEKLKSIRKKAGLSQEQLAGQDRRLQNGKLKQAFPTLKI